MSKTIKIPGRIESVATGKVVTGANFILDDTKGKKQNVINEETDAELLRLDQEKQGNLTFDQTPTEDSTNPVTSGGVYAADQILSQAIEAILLLIPSAASELNKLVDLATMNSSISTATASFKGTYNLVSDLHLTVSATHAQIAAALDALSLGADNNDYAYVQVPNTDTAPTDIAKTERYKFNGENWAYEYDLNNSGFTTAQWNAINSGITTLLVAKLSALPTNEVLTLALAGKQDSLTFDNAPTAGSNNPVKSGGIYTRNNEIVALINAIDAAKQDVLTFDTTPTNGSTNPVTSNGVYLAIQLVQTAVVALDGRMGTAETKISTAEGNIVNLQAAYAALTQSDIVVVEGVLPSSGQQQNIIYRQPDQDHTPPQFYSDYMWNGTAWVLMATYNNAIDQRPKKGSQNLVTSGGVFDNMGALDISELNATENPHTLTPYATLDAALAAIPSDYQKGGMSIKYVQSSDNNYVQYRLMAQSFTTDTTQWAICDDGVYVDNLDFMEVELDSNNKLLESRKKDGTKVIYTDLEVKGNIINENTNIDITDIVKTIESLYEGSHKMNIVTVKKDGSGDFTTIQEAINSITDANVINQYEVQVFDDYYVNDLSQLYAISSPTVHTSSDVPLMAAYIITKDYVHLRGMGGMREVYVENPNQSFPANRFQNVHNIFVIGNCRIENFVFKIKGGRYAMHQDLSGDLFGLDSFKTTVYKNIHAIHLGNSMYTNGSGWTSTLAQGNGIANGQTQVFINVTWDSYEGNSSFYGHFNQTYTLPCKVFILNCKYINRANIQNVGRQSCYLGDRYTGQRNTIYVYNSDLPTFLPNTMKMNPGSMADGTGEPITERSVKEICLPHVIGSGNSPMVTDASKINCLTFATKNLGEKIEVIGGTAKDDIFGVESKNIYGSGVKGETRGSNYIVEGTYSHVNNLAYILGNCANNPKTLIVRVTDVNNSYTDHIITFDKNYMTQDGSSYSYNTTPYISQSDIIAEVNDSFNDFTMSDGYWIVSTFDDCKDTLVNTGSTGLSQGMAVVRDYANGYKCVRMANAGEKAEGVAADSIAIGSIGDIILFKKNLMHRSYIHLGSLTKGTLYKVGSNGGFISTNTEDEAVLVAVDENILSYFGR